jgi:hypothetical protein
VEKQSSPLRQPKGGEWLRIESEPAARVILRCAHEKCIARMPLFSIFLGEDDVEHGLKWKSAWKGQNRASGS